MKNRLFCYIVGLFALGCVALATNPANAAIAAGPYYALPSWDQQLPSASRFIVLSNWGSAAVLDRETGLVWEQSPHPTAYMNWIDAQERCNKLTVGNRKGWRLPTIQELASLIDPSVAPPGPTLPADHPFSNVQNYYWSATTVADRPTWAWIAGFVNSNTSVSSYTKEVNYFVWCVRGGQGHDAQ